VGLARSLNAEVFMQHLRLRSQLMRRVVRRPAGCLFHWISEKHRRQTGSMNSEAQHEPRA
jgi:hypothetical protein